MKVRVITIRFKCQCQIIRFLIFAVALNRPKAAAVGQLRNRIREIFSIIKPAEKQPLYRETEVQESCTAEISIEYRQQGQVQVCLQDKMISLYVKSHHAFDKSPEQWNSFADSNNCPSHSLNKPTAMSSQQLCYLVWNYSLKATLSQLEAKMSQLVPLRERGKSKPRVPLQH